MIFLPAQEFSHVFRCSPGLLALAWLSEPQPSCASSGEHEPAMLVSLEFIRLDYVMYVCVYIYIYNRSCVDVVNMHIWVYMTIYIYIHYHMWIYDMYICVLLYELSMSSGDPDVPLICNI